MIPHTILHLGIPILTQRQRTLFEIRWRQWIQPSDLIQPIEVAMELVILTNTKDGDESIIYRIRWFKTLQSLGFTMEKLKRVNKRYLSIGATRKNILLTHSDSQNSNGFKYDLL